VGLVGLLEVQVVGDFAWAVEAGVVLHTLQYDTKKLRAMGRCATLSTVT
jgi:hypothetical protein